MGVVLRRPSGPGNGSSSRPASTPTGAIPSSWRSTVGRCRTTATGSPPRCSCWLPAGYVVLYANPRGSTSYGEEFGDLLYHNYPGQDYDDLISGVDAVIEQGYVDESNLFVTGGSAGGIMTAWIVGKTNRFRAAGVAEARRQLDQQDADRRQLVRLLLQPVTRVCRGRTRSPYWKFSPLSLVGNVETPTMIITGEEDLRTPAVRILPDVPRAQDARHRHGGDPAARRVAHDMSRRPSQAHGQDRQHRGVVRQVPDDACGQLTPDADR